MEPTSNSERSPEQTGDVAQTGREKIFVRLSVALNEPFDCGEDEQNEYISSQRAFTDAQAGLSVTHLLIIDNQLAGFVTLCGDEIPLYRRERPENADHYGHMPAVKIAQMGLKMEFRGNNYGRDLVEYAIMKTLKSKIDIGFRYITLDAKPRPKLVDWYKKLGFVVNEKDQESRLGDARKYQRAEEGVPISMRLDLLGIPEEDRNELLDVLRELELVNESG